MLVTPYNIAQHSISQTLGNIDTGWVNVYYVANDIDIKCRRVGKIVTVIGFSFGYVTLTAGKYTAVTTLDSQFRPKYEVPFTFNFIGGNPCGQAANIDSNGLINMYVTEDKEYWAFSVSYPVD